VEELDEDVPDDGVLDDDELDESLVLSLPDDVLALDDESELSVLVAVDEEDDDDEPRLSVL
jgi:hypothetical protein